MRLQSSQAVRSRRQSTLEPQPLHLHPVVLNCEAILITYSEDERVISRYRKSRIRQSFCSQTSLQKRSKEYEGGLSGKDIINEENE